MTISYSELQLPLFRLNDIWVSWVFVKLLFAHELLLVFWVCNYDSYFLTYSVWW